LVSSDVGLFHELVHAYLYYVAGKGTHAEKECMATGLGPYFASVAFNENRLRCELGLPLRPCYDETCDKYSAPSACGPSNQSGGANPVGLPSETTP
jgi:hypothetical protein